MKSWLRVGALVFLVLPGCDKQESQQEGSQGFERGDAQPCDPLFRSTRHFKGKLDIAVKGKGLRFFTFQESGAMQRRLFSEIEGAWTELRVTGSGIDERKNGDRYISLSCRDDAGRRAVFGYEVKGGRVVWAGYAVTDKNAESIEEIKELEKVVELEADDGFELPEAKEVKPLGQGKRLSFFAEFGEGEAILVVDADDKRSGVYVGTPKEMQVAENLEVIRFKDGGTRAFHFDYKGARASLRLPKRAEKGESQKDPSFSVGDEKRELSKAQGPKVDRSVIDSMVFRGCDRAHPEIPNF